MSIRPVPFDGMLPMIQSAIKQEPSGPMPFSIVMPAFNAAETLPAAIESLLAQTHTAFELLVIDDCSGDATAEIVRKYSGRNSRVRLIARTENTGAAACMNAGVELASHAWVAIFDADAIASDDWLARAATVAAAAEAEAWDAFGGGCDYFAPTNSFEQVTFAFEADDTAAAAETFGPAKAREPTIRGTNFFFTRACFDRVGGFAEDIRAAYDRLFLCNAIERGCKVRFDPALRVGHPLPGSSVNEFLRRKNAIERWRLVAAERSPILRQVYRPIWPVIVAGILACSGMLWFLGPIKGVIGAGVAAGIILGVFTVKGIGRGLPLALAVQYAAINIVKKACTMGIYVFGLRPAGLDWKRR